MKRNLKPEIRDPKEGRIPKSEGARSADGFRHSSQLRGSEFGGGRPLGLSVFGLRFSELARRRTASSGIVLTLLLPFVVFANPQGMTVVAGSASAHASGS